MICPLYTCSTTNTILIMQNVNEEWLSDKARFSYDGLKRQRLLNPMVKDAQGMLVDTNWEEALFSIADQVYI